MHFCLKKQRVSVCHLYFDNIEFVYYKLIFLKACIKKKEKKKKKKKRKSYFTAKGMNLTC